MHLSGPILESKGMHAIFQKKARKRVKKIVKGQKWAKYLKIWAKNAQIRKYSEKQQVIVYNYHMQYTVRKGSVNTGSLTFPNLYIKYKTLNSHCFTMCHTVSLPFSRSHGRFFISHGFTNFEQMFSKTHNFLKKQTQAAHSNVNKEHISSMTNKIKTSIHSFLSLTWALLFIMLVKTYIGVPFQ